MNTPNAEYKNGIYACSVSCTIVTKDATITIKAGIRTLSGITFLNKEIKILDKINTTVVERPIPKPFIAVEVTANVGHMPSIMTKVGFSLMIPLWRRSVNLFIIRCPLSHH